MNSAHSLFTYKVLLVHIPVHTDTQPATCHPGLFLKGRMAVAVTGKLKFAVLCFTGQACPPIPELQAASSWVLPALLQLSSPYHLQW